MSLRGNLLFISGLVEYFLNHYSDGFDDLYHPGRYLFNSFEPSVNRQAIQKTLSSLASKGLLKKHSEKGYYQLTPVGWSKVGKIMPLEKVKEEGWDGLWRVVVYDISEERRSERNFLRRHLKELGFRLWQKSTWITPLGVSKELYDLLKEKKMSGRISVFESRNLFGLSDRELTSKVWNLDKIESNYHKFVDDWKKEKGTVGRNPLKIKDLARRMQLRYLNIAQKDPHLPLELLPEKWPSEGIKNVLSSIRSILSSKES